MANREHAKGTADKGPRGMVITAGQGDGLLIMKEKETQKKAYHKGIGCLGGVYPRSGWLRWGRSGGFIRGFLQEKAVPPGRIEKLVSGIMQGH